MEIIEVDEFAKDLKKIKIDLEDDLERYKKVLKTYYPNFECSSVGAVKISHLGVGILPMYKAKKFRCKALQSGSKSPIRVIFTYNKYQDRIILIEIYTKSKKKNQDKKRIEKYAIKMS